MNLDMCVWKAAKWGRRGLKTYVYGLREDKRWKKIKAALIRRGGSG